MDKESIDREYADLCIKYGDVSQKIIHLEEQEKIQLEAIESQKEAYERAYREARLPLRKELRQIEDRWKELKELVKETHLQPEASKPE